MRVSPQHRPSPHVSSHQPRPSSRTGFLYSSSGPVAGSPGSNMRGPGVVDQRTEHFAVPTTNSFSFPHPGPGSPVGYFSGAHHRNRRANGRGHRREPAGISVNNLGTAPSDTNAFGDPGTESDDEAEFRAPTPRATVGPPGMTPFAFGEPGVPPPGTPGAGSLHQRSGTPASIAGSSGVGFIPPRPPSSSAATEDFVGAGAFSPRHVPLPASGPTSVYTSHSGSVVPGAPNDKAALRNREVSVMSGGPNGQPALRTAFGNTPFVRSSGLYDD